MIDKMIIKNWKLQENNCGNFRIILYLKSVKNQFGGRKDYEKLFYDKIKHKNAHYYNTEYAEYISTNYASSKETFKSIKGILEIIDKLNQWIDKENHIRKINKSKLHEKLVQKLYPISEMI